MKKFLITTLLVIILFACTDVVNELEKETVTLDVISFEIVTSDEVEEMEELYGGIPIIYNPQVDILQALIENVDSNITRSCTTCVEWRVYLVHCPGENNTLLCRKKECTKSVRMPGINCGP